MGFSHNNWLLDVFLSQLRTSVAPHVGFQQDLNMGIDSHCDFEICYESTTLLLCQCVLQYYLVDKFVLKACCPQYKVALLPPNPEVHFYVHIFFSKVKDQAHYMKSTLKTELNSLNGVRKVNFFICFAF